MNTNQTQVWHKRIGLTEEHGHVCHVGCGQSLICQIRARPSPLASKVLEVNTSVALQGHHIPEREAEKHERGAEEEEKKKKSTADRHNKSMQGGTDHRLWALEPCGKLGK